jgi:hypothetical protein
VGVLRSLLPPRLSVFVPNSVGKCLVRALCRDPAWALACYRSRLYSIRLPVSESMCTQRGWGMFPGTLLASRTDSQVARIVAVNGTHRLPDALAPLINVRRGAEGDKLADTKCRGGVNQRNPAKMAQMALLTPVFVKIDIFGAPPPGQ